MKALLLIELCAREYQDIGYARIARDSTSATTTNQPAWLDWLNDSARAIVLVRPDAGALTQSLVLVAGTKQSLPPTAISILGVTRNMGAAPGTTPGKTIRMAKMDTKNDTNRDWHTAADAGVVREVIYDEEKDPLTFYVSPPANGKYIEMSLCMSPTAILDANVAVADFPLPDLYCPPAQEWMLFRAYAMASESAVNYKKAWNHFQAFFQLVGVKLRAQLFSEAIAQGNRTSDTRMANG